MGPPVLPSPTVHNNKDMADMAPNIPPPGIWCSSRPVLSQPAIATRGSPPKGSKPLFPRTGHSTCATPNGDIYIFGGLVKGTLSNELYRYSTKNNTATLLTCTGTPPSPRRYHTSALKDNVLVVMGGNTNEKYYDDGLYVLNLETKYWSRIDVNKPKPCARMHHASAFVDSKFYVFGGSRGVGNLNDLWAIDIDTIDPGKTESTWTPVGPSPSTLPTPRENTACFSFEKQLIILGGHDGSSDLSDTWSFDLNEKTWTQWNCKGPKPGPRWGRNAMLVDDFIYAFGSHNLVALKLSEKKWYQLPSVAPGPCSREYYAIASVASKLFLLGGAKSSIPRSPDSELELVYSLDTRDIEEFAYLREQERRTMKETLYQAGIKLTNLGDELERTKIDLSSTKISLKSKEDQFDEKEKELTAMTEAKNAKEKDLITTEEKLNATKEKLGVAKKDLVKIKNDLESTGKKLGATTKDLTETTKKLESKETEFNTLKAKFDANETELVRRQEELIAVMKENKTREEELTTIRTQLQTKEEELATTKSQKTALEQELADMKKDKGTMDNELVVIRKELATMKNEKDAKELDLNATRKELGKKETELNAMQKDLDETKNKLGARQRDLAAMTEKNDAREKDLAATKKDLAVKEKILEKREKELAALVLDRDAKEVELAATRKDLERRESELDVTTKDRDKKERELNKIKNDLDRKKTELDAKEKELDATKKELKSIDDDLVATKNDLAVEKGNLVETETKLKEAESTLEAREKELVETKIKLDAMEQDLAAARRDLSSTSDKLQGAKEMVEKLQARLTDLGRDAEGHKATLSRALDHERKAWDKKITEACERVRADFAASASEAVEKLEEDIVLEQQHEIDMEHVRWRKRHNVREYRAVGDKDLEDLMKRLDIGVKSVRERFSKKLEEEKEKEYEKWEAAGEKQMGELKVAMNAEKEVALKKLEQFLTEEIEKEGNSDKVIDAQAIGADAEEEQETHVGATTIGKRGKMDGDKEKMLRDLAAGLKA